MSGLTIYPSKYFRVQNTLNTADGIDNEYIWFTFLYNTTHPCKDKMVGDLQC